MNRFRSAMVLALLLAFGAQFSAALGRAEDQQLPAQQFKRDQRVKLPCGTLNEAITNVKAAGWMEQYPDGDFHPERSLNRAELASIIATAFHLEKRDPVITEDVTLKDVPEKHWAFSGIQNVVSRGIMQGYRNGYFYPNQPVSRAEALAIIAQAYGVYQFDDSILNAILSNYPDSNQIPVWGRKAVATSLKAGLVDIQPSSKIRPLQPMTRGDMAYALNQYLQQLNHTEQPTIP